ncbi:MAG: hypothetical protein Q8930_01350 [Bacillota bacterium]|nr:hypothetical protein [Bacillota bacterium]
MLRLFNEYFLALVIIPALIVIFGDSKYFIKNNRKGEARKARFVGTFYIIVALVLYVANKLK